uniref:Threonylcarbamoyl-AMP synthase n=1 Tax=Alexandrium monilatum TaxID=311494 RepID=A0A7S4S808_9DINO
MAGPTAEDSAPLHKRPAPGADEPCSPALPDSKRAAVVENGTAPEEAAMAERACILRPPHGAGVFQELAARLRRGLLVSFPTETVYGLGANGLDAKAVLGIFEAKGRPLSDPCILHVAAAAEAEQLMELDRSERAVFGTLAAACWPGPLSIVGKAKAVVPPEVTASTGFVAVRCPDHALARQLIAEAGVPLAAPSANRFGHISPTLPEHVLEDLGHVDTLRILDGGACGVGIESTVLRLDLAHGRVVILRKGGVTKERLEAVLADALAAGSLASAVAVEYSERLSASAEGLRQREAACPEQPQESPGLLLRHYSPSVPSALLLPRLSEEASGERLPYHLDRSVLIDFGGSLQVAHKHFLKTFDLCGQRDSCEARSSVEEACSRAFAVLRAAEAFALEHEGAFICIADFDAARLGSFAEALHDRMFRAASGRRVALHGLGAGAEPHFVELSGGAP